MKKTTILFLAIALNFAAFAQINAVTETGEAVYLYEDGQWSYVDEKVSVVEEIPTNETPFTKGDDASFLVKSKRIDSGIWINPKMWKFSATEGEESEFMFTLKTGDLFGMLIAEKIEIPLATLRNLAIQNAKSVSPDLKVVKEEYRTVNGRDLLMMQMMGTIQGIKFAYFGYYYSSPNGCLQLLTYTSQNMFEEHEATMESLLNGLVKLD